MSFSERLKELRQLNNFTQQELADYLAVSRVTYTNYERGHSEPNLNTIKLLASHFKVSTDYLLDFNDDTLNKNKTKKLLLGLEAELKKINRTFELEIKSLLIDLLNLIKTNQLSSSDVTKWLIDINEKHLECSSELLRFISEMPKDFDPIFDLTDIYQILNSNDK
ncbi:TPA: helix-turn-helix transcriptional regulator [Streptococcus pyogenes]|uniref:helix-turn-helix domain-containing protein n=1 Tax=Streptococcus pyogenes TaxID=1314 RepID=UPI000DA4214B|nr:helix-turn-helix transcriptional regulator [Streptococcus pyogenes]HER4512573.1 helix-turn-helix transcriptional regulator [Streptococcus pyogenes NGAS729]HER4517707.1 helix-turn-helix transcriptional regulator [Streptococcus pyogenes NGAS732]NSX77191.1 helix-turn-helix transcriptional regulator [Streptococcus pyogenes]NTS71827.1 helix-turn-helix transcriptional regulator [Streptococcus pyogenes]SQG23633.1 transcriptional regulator [Streptococcus pyogenes]